MFIDGFSGYTIKFLQYFLNLKKKISGSKFTEYNFKVFV